MVKRLHEGLSGFAKITATSLDFESATRRKYCLPLMAGCSAIASGWLPTAIDLTNFPFWMEYTLTEPEPKLLTYSNELSALTTPRTGFPPIGWALATSFA